MADNISIKDAAGVTNTVRTADIGSNVHVPIHRLDTLVVTGPAAQSAANTDLLTGTVNGWFDASAFASGSVQIIAGAGISAGAITIEQTNDSTLAATGVPVQVQEAGTISIAPQASAYTIAANTQRVFNFPISARYIRVRISTAFVGGTVQAVAFLSQDPYAAPIISVGGSVTNTNNANIFYSESVTPLAASASAPLTTRDTGAALTAGVSAAHRYSAFNAFAFADQAGTMRIECSQDNSTWRRMTADVAVAANTPVILSVPVMARYHRVVYANGATLQTAFMLNTSYTAA